MAPCIPIPGILLWGSRSISYSMIYFSNLKLITMRRFTYILLAGALLVLGSCKKYLNTVPDDVLTVDDIFKSKANVDAYLANIYSSLPDELQQRFVGSGNSGPWLGASDEAKYNWDFVYSNQMNLSVWSNTDGSVENFWLSYYQAIRNATDFMNR